MTIELRDVTMENYFDVLNLDVKEYQKQFIATNAISLAEAYVYTKMEILQLHWQFTIMMQSQVL